MKNGIANIAFLPLALLSYFLCPGQQSDSMRVKSPAGYRASIYKSYIKTEIITGVNFQTSNYDKSKETRRYVELGVARSVHKGSRHGPVSAGYYISEEIYFGAKNIYGTKLGIYTHYLIDMGFAAIYYTDFSRGNVKLRPELGFGMGLFRIAGGYNIPTFGNKSFEALRKSNGQLTVQFLIPVKKKVIDCDGNIFRELF